MTWHFSIMNLTPSNAIVIGAKKKLSTLSFSWYAEICKKHKRGKLYFDFNILYQSTCVVSQTETTMYHQATIML